MHGISGFVVRRVLLGLLTLLVVSVIVFAATQALPGDPAQAILGRDATPEAKAALREELDLNEPAFTQYTSWLGGVLTGDLGNSLATRQPVSEVIGTPLINSAFLVFLGALLSMPLAIFIGAVSAWRRDGAFDHTTTLGLLALFAIPEFVLAITLVLLFATTVFPVFPAVSLIPPDDMPWMHMDRVALPLLTVILLGIPHVARIMRASMIEVLESDYVEMARLKGVSERRVLWAHAVPNAIAPAIQVIALNLSYLAGGIVLIEFVFAYSGIGTLLVEAVTNRDVPLVQALVMIIAAVYVVVNLLADVATVLVSPRQRTSLP